MESEIQYGRYNGFPNQGIFGQAHKRNTDILKYKEAFTLRDYKGKLPVHYLAGYSIREVLDYPECFEAQDDAGDTIFHALAGSGCREVLQYPEAYSQKNKKQLTPIDILLKNLDIKVSMLSEEYQRRARILRFAEDRLVSKEDLLGLMKTPNSLLFILEMADSL